MINPTYGGTLQNNSYLAYAANPTGQNYQAVQKSPFKGGDWRLGAASPGQGNALQILRQNLLKQLDPGGSYQSQMASKLWAESEPRFAAAMGRRGLTGSTAYGSGLGRLAADIGYQSFMGGQQNQKNWAQYLPRPQQEQYAQSQLGWDRQGRSGFEIQQGIYPGLGNIGQGYSGGYVPTYYDR